LKKIYTLIFINLLIPAWLWNHELFLLINGFNSPIANHIIGFTTGFADGLVATVLIGILMLFKLRLGLAALLAGIFSGIFIQILKRIFDMPRPPTVFGDVHLLGERLSFHSFPSGHATTAGALAILSLLLWEKKPALAWLGFALSIFMAYGRIYGGVHFPLDVVIGFGIGALSMYWCNKWSKRWQMKAWATQPWAWRLSSLFLFVTAIALASSHSIQPDTAQPLTQLVPALALMAWLYAWQQQRKT